MRTLKVTALLVAIVLVPVSLALVLVAQHSDRQAATRTLTRSAAAALASALGETAGDAAAVRNAVANAAATSPGLDLAVLDAQQHAVAVARHGKLLDAHTAPAPTHGMKVATAHPAGRLATWTVSASAPSAAYVGSADVAPIVLTALAVLLLGFVITRRGPAEAGPPLDDALTGLGNRRRLELDLERLLPHASESEPILLALLDLEGFKTYNDSFGRTAGDALLSRLGKNLAHAVEGRGTAYRMGGDEFCVVVRVGVDGQAPVLADAVAALSERGDAFAIASAQGSVLLPKEASDVASALRIADQRLYAGKATDSRSAGRQSADVLLQALHERSPELGSHLHDVALTAKEVGKRLGMSGEELDQIAQAAELHDVGKMAIPDAILKKPGPLDHEEWEFIRGHTIIGERIVSAAPALAPVAKLIRSSHERFNGTGYPDSLKGDEIPLGARVVAVCDAYDAMIGPRPYRLGLSKEDAISELRRCANAQFDPVVVDVFCQVVDGLELEDDEDEAVIASRRH
jgi:diguanylate cyclase (GGDEF)-like protein